MRNRRMVGVGLWLCFALGQGSALAQALQAEGVVPDQPTADAGLERVRSARLDAYREVLADFDAATRSAPDDVAAAVNRCEYIGKFTDDESGDWLDSAYDDFERCAEDLKAKWPRAPQAQLFALDQLWGKEAVAFGEPLLAAADHWPSAWRKHLFTAMSDAYNSQDKSQRAGELAVAAARLGEPSCVARAVTYLAGKREFAAAQTLLRSAPAATDAWSASKRVSAAMALPRRDAAREELLRYRQSDFDVGAAVAAQAYLRAGEVKKARAILQKEDGKSATLQTARFDVALAAADLRGAAGLVKISDTDHMAENAQRFALVAARSPAMLLTAPMLRSAGFLVLLLTLISVASGLVLVPVHYRGLIRRLNGRPAAPLFEEIGLVQGWLGFCVVLCAPVLGAIAMEPQAVATLFGGTGDMPPGTLFRAMYWGTALGLVCLVPVARRIGVQQFIGDRAALRGAWRVLVAWAILIAVGVAITLVNKHSGGDTQTAQTRMIDSLVGGGLDNYGLWATMLLMAGLVPMFEETVFRGLLLGGLTRHISFGWANTAQAALFATIHDDLPRFPFYFAMGLLAGWLVKKTRALGPAMGLHMLNNGLAVLIRHWQ
jgi:membrane protease YdiL (CAAX protease family)